MHMLNPKSREAFAKVEIESYGYKQAVFADGKVTWVTVRPPEPIEEPKPLGHVKTASYDTEADWYLTPAGQLTCGKFRGPLEIKQIKVLERWFNLGPESKEPFLTRAERNMCPDDVRKYREYAAYYLYARGSSEPLTPDRYATERARNKNREKVSNKRKRKQPQTP